MENSSESSRCRSFVHHAYAELCFDLGLLRTMNSSVVMVNMGCLGIYDAVCKTPPASLGSCMCTLNVVLSIIRSTSEVLSNIGSKRSLFVRPWVGRNTSATFDRIQNPHRQCPISHVTGTAGPRLHGMVAACRPKDLPVSLLMKQFKPCIGSLHLQSVWI